MFYRAHVVSVNEKKERCGMFTIPGDEDDLDQIESDARRSNTLPAFISSSSSSSSPSSAAAGDAPLLSDVAGGNNAADIPLCVARHLARRLAHAEGNAKGKEERTDRTEATEFSITYQHLVDLYCSQENRCWYSHLEMSFEEGDSWYCSLERLDRKQGYIPENIALVVGELNGGQQWTTERISSLYALIRQSVNLAQLKAEIAGARIPYKPTGRGKRNCQPGLEWRRHMMQKASAAKNREAANAKDHRKRDAILSPEQVVSFDELLDKLEEQQGRCFYSGIPLQHGLNVAWRCSVERLNNDIGYTNENTVLVCVEFNTRYQWSMAKFAHFLASCVAHGKVKVPPLIWDCD